MAQNMLAQSFSSLHHTASLHMSHGDAAPVQEQSATPAAEAATPPDAAEGSTEGSAEAEEAKQPEAVAPAEDAEPAAFAAPPDIGDDGAAEVGELQPPVSTRFSSFTRLSTALLWSEPSTPLRPASCSRR